MTPLLLRVTGAVNSGSEDTDLLADTHTQRTLESRCDTRRLRKKTCGSPLVLLREGE